MSPTFSEISQTKWISVARLIAKMDAKADALFEQIHEASDCVLKHSFTSPVYLQEGIQAAIQKGIDPDELIRIHAQQTELAQKINSLLLPDTPNLSQIQELWQAVGWMNGAEEHMTQKYEEHTTVKDGQVVLKEGVASELKEYFLSLPLLIHAQRQIRRNLERTIFRSMAQAHCSKAPKEQTQETPVAAVSP